jgi:hypothetical protein
VIPENLGVRATPPEIQYAVHHVEPPDGRVLLTLVGTWFLCMIGGCQSSSEPETATRQSWRSKISKTAHAGEDLESPVEYRAELDVERLEGSMWVLLNGFPTYSLEKGRFSRDHVDPPINTGLVGTGIEYAFRVEPWTEPAGSTLRVGEVKLEGRVSANEEQIVPGSQIHTRAVDSAYRAWIERARAKWRDYQSRTVRGALDSIRAWAEQNPMTVSTTFDNEAGPDYSHIFEEAPIIERTPADSARLKDYALHLRDLMIQRDTSALVAEFEPLMRDAYRRGKREGESFAEFRSVFRKNLVLEDAEDEFDFSREDVRLKRWADGRVWQLRREEAEGLLRRIEVYVAEIDGELKVVR